ncbi:hypothetical protein B0G80_9102 [Paraburkholderia sp. BL6669N2]|nr:hypothetical protein B0G80_9102 [Paraburkholderia sp. BL6669N2]
MLGFHTSVVRFLVAYLPVQTIRAGVISIVLNASTPDGFLTMGHSETHFL